MTTFRWLLAGTLLASIALHGQVFAGTAPLVLYTFDEGKGDTVRDVGGTGLPLDLTIANPGAAAWNTNGSLKIKAATLIASASAATKVSNALKASNAVTVDTWIRPENTTQTGPARILTLSRDDKLRNFTLGQETASYNVRLRTSSTDANGMPAVSSAAGTLAAKVTHVVYTRAASGAVSLYINGVKKLQTTVTGNFGNWDGAYRLALGNELNGGRPWLGSYHRLAVYDRAFSATEVSQSYAAGKDAPAGTATNTTGTATSTSKDTVPVAVNDSVNSTSGGVTIAPLANDSGLENTPVTLRIVSGPSHGKAYDMGSNLIAYIPTSTFAGTDSFTYRVTDADGDVATATVSISVTCSTCASVSTQSLNVSWLASPGSVIGYYVYYGATASTASTFASTVTGPSTTYSTSAKDLNLQTGSQVCFRVKAYNTVGVSGYSSAVCRTI
jgi:hypothetical protein